MRRWETLYQRNTNGGRYRPSLEFDFVSSPSATGNRGGTLSNTRAGTALFVGSDGLIQTASANAPLFTYDPTTLICEGILPGRAWTDVLGTTNAIRRTMTDGGWVTSNMTVGAATGADGVGSASASLTATAGNATIKYTTVLGAAVRNFSARVRRKTGTGVVNITIDNGVNWTPMTLTSVYLPFSVNSASVANPIVGFQIVTSGDAIEVDYNTLVAGTIRPYLPPPVNVSTAADLITLPVGSWYNALAGALYTEWNNPSTAGTYVPSALNDTTTNNYIGTFIQTLTNMAAAVVTGGATQASFNTGAATSGGMLTKTMQIYAANDFTAFTNNVIMGTDTNGTVPTITRLEIGSNGGANQLNAPIPYVAYYPYRPPSGPARSLTA